MTNDSTYWKNKTVIVSGGLGFIGSHFVEELSLIGANVICLYKTPNENLTKEIGQNNVQFIQADLLNDDELAAICKKPSGKVDSFIHCAALDGNTQFKIEYAAKILDNNNRLVSNVLNSCRDNSIPNVAILGSSEVYSSNSPEIISELDDFHRYFTYSPNGYFLSKVFAEINAELYQKQYGMNIYVPRPTNVYGPRDSFDANTSRVIPAMIKKVSRSENIEIWGDGKQTRSFIYVKDLVQTTLLMIEKRSTGPLNIATRDQVSILDLAKYISKEYGAKELINLDISKPTGAKARRLNVDKMYDLIDFEPLPIEKGINSTVNWYSSLDNKI